MSVFVLRYKQLPNGGVVTVDLVAEQIVIVSVERSTEGTAVLMLDCYRRQSTYPIPLLAWVQLEDNGTILFEGFCWDVQPSKSNLVKIKCFGTDHMASREIPVMNLPWDGGSPPTPAVGAVPRLVMNCYNLVDDDYGTQRTNGLTNDEGLLVNPGLTVGNMLATVFDDAEPFLVYLLASTGQAYVSAQLDAMTHIPMDKEVIESEQLGGAIRQLRTYIKDRKFVWIPGERKWSFYDPNESPTETVTLNQSNQQAEDSDTPIVLFMELHRILDGKLPAVRFVGPNATVLGTFTWDVTTPGSNNLEPYGDATYLETYTDETGDHDVNAYSSWIIEDPTLRAGAHILPKTAFPVFVSMPMGVSDPGNPSTEQFIQTTSPNLEISFDNGETYGTVQNARFDFINGIVTTNYPMYYWDARELNPPSNQHFWPVTNARLTWASYTAPLEVRYPTSGYEGTSNSIAGMTTELTIYMPELAVGINDSGMPETTQYRLDQAYEIARHLHAERKDIAYVGTLIMHGMRYEYLNLNRRINLRAYDPDGVLQTTGWEDIRAHVTNVKWNFGDQTTEVTCSSDVLQEMGVSLDEWKKRMEASEPRGPFRDY